MKKKDLILLNVFKTKNGNIFYVDCDSFCRGLNNHKCIAKNWWKEDLTAPIPSESEYDVMQVWTGEWCLYNVLNGIPPTWERLKLNS